MKRSNSTNIQTNIQTNSAIPVEELDQAFDEGGDILQFADMSTARRPLQEPKRVNVDFPAWMIAELDLESGRLGVTRQSLIKMWIADRLDKLAS